MLTSSIFCPASRVRGGEVPGGRRGIRLLQGLGHSGENDEHALRHGRPGALPRVRLPRQGRQRRRGVRLHTGKFMQPISFDTPVCNPDINDIQVHIKSAAGVVVSCKIPILVTRVQFPGGAWAQELLISDAGRSWCCFD